MANNKDFKVKNGIQPTVYNEGVGTVVSGSEGYYLAGASYDSVSFSVASEETNPSSLFFKSDGTKMYVCGTSGDDVNEYSLSTAWDVSTASYTTAFSVSANALNPEGIFFKPDGTKMYVWGISSSVIAEYDLSTAWDVSTASLNDTATFTTQVPINNGQDITLNGDGTKLYIIGGSNTIYQYSLSTAYDITTASYDSVSINVSTYSNSPADLTFNSDGTRLYVIAFGPDTVAEYALTTAYDLSTASYNNVSFDISGQMGTSQGLYFKPDGTKMYATGQTADAVYQYSTVLTTASLDLSTGAVFDYTPTSDVQVTVSNPAASGTVSSATLLLTGEDGTGVGSTFSTTLYTGNGSETVISNGINLSTDGGLVWLKKRSGIDNHALYDTERGATKYLSSSTSGTEATIVQGVKSFNTDGFTIGDQGGHNDNGADFVSWTFKKQSSFFDVVTWAGDGNGSNIPKALSHSLGSVPGMIVLKTTSGSASSWSVWHRGLDTHTGTLDGADAFLTSDLRYHFGNGSSYVAPTSTTFTTTYYNETGKNYLAYLWGHDTSADGLIQCGSYTGNGSTSGPIINLGWEPQWLLLKNTSTGGTGWIIVDTERNLGSGNDYILQPQSSGAEITNLDYYTPSSTGFQVVTTSDGANTSGNNYIYVAIRNPYIPTITYDTDLEWSGGTAPTSPAIGETDVITISTRDGGTTYQAIQAIDGAK